MTATIIIHFVSILTVDAIALGSASFGQGEGPVLLDDLSCSGGEPDIFSCSSGGVGNTNCRHHEDAAVICNGMPVILTTDLCNTKSCKNNSV